MARFVVGCGCVLLGLLAGRGRPAQGQGIAARGVLAQTPARQANLTARQRAWLQATPQERVTLAESLGEEGARAIAKSKGYTPIFDGFEKAIPQGPDQVYRGRNGVVHVFEAKGGSGQLGHAYGHLQGSAEWAVESAKRVLRSTKATFQQKTAAQEILKAASQGKLEVHVVRTSHILGEPSAAILEQSVRTSPKAMRLAREALDDLVRAAAQNGDDAARVGARLIDDLARSTDDVARETAKTGGKVLRSATKAAVVVGVGIDVGLRARDAADAEHRYAEGEISQQQRVVTHAENAGGFVGGWGGAAGGAKIGAVAGGAVGALFGGVGVPIGAAIGGISGGIGGYFGGEWAGEQAAGAAAVGVCGWAGS